MRILTLLQPLLGMALLVASLFTVPAGAATKSKASEADVSPPMRFVIVRSHEAGCEPNCAQWISAEGEVTPQTPAVFKKFLKQVGKNRLPVLINSLGGDVEASMALGKLIRSRGLDAGVGWTLFAGCWPEDKGCKLPADQKGVYRGIPITWRAYCVASCSFVLAGGRTRLATGTTIAVTPLAVTVTNERVVWEERYRMVNGKRKVVSRKIVKREKGKTYTTTKLDKTTRRKLDAFAGAMGLGKGFIPLFGKAIPEQVYYVTGREALSAKLITSMESARTLVDNNLCQAAPVADNCIERVATMEQKSTAP